MNKAAKVSLNVKWTMSKLFFNLFILFVLGFLYSILRKTALETDVFKAFGANNYGYSAFWYRVEVYNRWGDRVFVREETADQPTINLHNRFYDNSWIRWDGKVNGQWVNDATFVWHINMENCSDQRKSQGNLPENWKGEVNVFR